MILQKMPERTGASVVLRESFSFLVEKTRSLGAKKRCGTCWKKTNKTLGPIRMIKAPQRICVHVRRVASRTLRSERLLRRHVVRGAAISLVPSAINDVAFHHAQLNVNEIIHVTQDTITITTLNTLASIIVTASKVL